MKGKDLFLLAGGALLVYMVIPKEKVQAAAGGVSIIPQLIPGPTEIIERLVSGPAQLIPQLIPGATQFIPQLIPGPTQFITEQGIPGISEFDLEAWFRRTFGISEDGDQEANGDGTKVWKPLPDVIVESPTVEVTAPEITIGGKGIVEAAADFASSVLTAPGEFLRRVFAPAGYPEEREESEAVFEKAGFSEVIPSNIDVFIKAQEAITGEAAEEIPAIGTTEYLEKMLGYPKAYKPLPPTPEKEMVDIRKLIFRG